MQCLLRLLFLTSVKVFFFPHPFLFGFSLFVRRMTKKVACGLSEKRDLKFKKHTHLHSIKTTEIVFSLKVLFLDL